MGVSLGLVGIVDKGIYNPDETYNKGNFVLHEGSTWLALKDNLQGVEPAEGESWKFLARGFAAEILSLITAVDSAGLVGNAGAETDGQTLLDAIADKVANQLLEKKMMSNVQVNDATMVPTSALVYAMQQALTNLNSNFKLQNVDQVTFKYTASGFPQIEMKSLENPNLKYTLMMNEDDSTTLLKSVDNGNTWSTVWVGAKKSDLGQYTTWTPGNLTVSTPHRCYYVKNGATLTVWLMGALNEALPANGIKVICSDIKTRFGVSNAYDAFGIGYGGTIPVKITAVSNELKVEALGTEVASGAFIFGYVTLGIK